ncbi:MAG TPA: hypothetical protein VIY48_20650 [Candidatus Paceibacterota bacterium]
MIDYGPKFVGSKSSEFDDVEKLFLCYQSAAFLDRQDLRYEISKKIAGQFHVSISSIRFCGSAHIGSSPHKNTPFVEGTSDLDVAIINESLFETYLMHAMNNSRGLQDLSCFPVKDGYSTRDSFCQYAARGIFRPDIMPNCPQRTSWMTFFSKLSRDYSMFSDINAGLYLSERLFLEKQRNVVARLRKQGEFK